MRILRANRRVGLRPTITAKCFRQPESDFVIASLDKIKAKQSPNNCRKTIIRVAYPQ
ncbi:MAG: hypothetical protein IJV35_10960 [Neisseriaceae bacterium]|nr:hypothetical protein [Neisseriaceae bacterium]